MAVKLEVEEKEKDEKERHETLIKRWLEAKELYEKYPEIIKALSDGKYLKEYNRMIEEIAKGCKKKD